MTDTMPTETPEPVDTAEPVDGESPHGVETDAEGETFTREYVERLRAEAAAHRVKAKRTDDANARLTASYAAATGRLVDVDALPYTEDLLGDDGLVDPERVAAAVDTLVQAKPYLARRTPTTPISQGVRTDVAEPPGLFSLIRDRS